MIEIREAIVVEGRYDKNTLSQIVDAPIFETHGFGILKNKKMLGFLRQVAKKRGLIILTDSDGAGLVIRNYLRGAIPKEHLRHGYIPEILGKEKRKIAPSKAGTVGVEGMSREVLVNALRNAGATIVGEEALANSQPITKLDLFELGLNGGAGSSEKRKKLMEKLEIPTNLGANALLDALNILYNREEFFQYMRNEA
ncbi:MAG: DUF4093 domain-containing protein [Eubacteriales bacterium]